MERVAVRLPNWMGDVIMATPFLRELGKENALVLVGKSRFREIIDGLYEEFIGYNGIYKTAEEVRKRKTEVIFVLPNSFGSALFSFLSGARIRIGYAKEGRTFLLTHPVSPPKKVVNMPTYYLSLIPRLYGGDVPPFTGLHVSVKEFEIGLKRYAVFIPGASFGPSKMWPTAHFAKLADMLHAYYGLHIAIPPGPGEEKLAREIARGKPFVKVFDRPILTPGELAFLIKHSSLLVTNDTGPRHMGEALGVPTFVLMGPTDPRYTNYPSKHTTVIRREVPCSPCHKKVCRRNLECLTLIRPEHVFKEIKSRLAL